MPILTLVCEHCGLLLIIGSKNKKAAEAIFDYGKINPILGKPYELNCLCCGHPMVKARAYLNLLRYYQIQTIISANVGIVKIREIWEILNYNHYDIIVLLSLDFSK